ncbi:hypothetical protein [uncultured Desulfovibrio sp.]|jgi:hypothetical protein|uniref:hypothetical protein n=1 Tax=uncultured Desulfovibrio sp. TaxID=167968 RepID=UPI002618A754|nr:hypothetical protein [uncultured Desulfovibrio sp.]
MINLHAAVRSAITGLHPDEAVALRQSVGQQNVRGRITPVYAPEQTVQAQIQSLGQNDLAQAEQTSNTRVDRKAYLYAPNPALPPQGIVRPLARNGDMLRRADGTWWLVTAMIEDFTASGWVCVGITQQVDGPDLSASDAGGGNADA